MICAVVLAAGQSRRMGTPKLALPWGDTSVVGRVVATLQNAGITQIIVVIGSAEQSVESALAGQSVQIVVNLNFAEGEMLSSLQAGLAAANPVCDAALVVLGDQPHMQAEVVDAVMAQYAVNRDALVVPSFEMRRGHPWLVDRRLWPEIAALRAPQSARDFLNSHADEIVYVNVDTPTILKDLDTPQDYQRDHPK